MAAGVQEGALTRVTYHKAMNTFIKHSNLGPNYEKFSLVESSALTRLELLSYKCKLRPLREPIVVQFRSVFIWFSVIVSQIRLCGSVWQSPERSGMESFRRYFKYRQSRGFASPGGCRHLVLTPSYCVRTVIGKAINTARFALDHSCSITPTYSQPSEWSGLD
ncbi:hypothetical protein TcasGA2_TC009687 [Tribolium castaneum]|uniref:Uncharacterized protein n=1 Tax=Tribolium castaneum TaxID=7070 RepID=D6WU33_TRICA|nr:hypothetical protein TcasGA2_TC009687 [Tribolium castaneum]